MSNQEYYSIIKAFQLGNNDKLLKKPYKNPFDKNKQRDKHKAYKNGYQQ